MFRLRRVCLKSSDKLNEMISILPPTDQMTRIGRHSHNDVCLMSTDNELLISRWHAQIRHTLSNITASENVRQLNFTNNV